MSLAVGRKLGPYEILSALGAGGMGEVYRARDTRLERIVAIKILASHLASSPDLRQRFEREARTVSSLNHAHICQLFDVGSQDGTDYLVMELLEGETLSERLLKGALPLAEVLRIGREVAEALQVAHRAGIVHRDLKPGNIMLTKAGAKLMDFGLAKPAMGGGAASGTAPLLSAARTASGPSPLSPLTMAGSIVGTIQYMAPEQIEGKEADARSDIFALGAVLYEMATGKRAFEGKSQLSVASAILEKEPEPMAAQKPLTPPVFEHVVQRALAKSPDERWQSASDVRGELQWIAAAGAATSPVVAVGSGHRKQDRLGWWLAAALGVSTLVLAAVFYRQANRPGNLVVSSILAPEKASFGLRNNAGGQPVLSQDGTMVAFIAQGEGGRAAVWLRRLDMPQPRRLAGTEGATYPFWSPDGTSIGFFANGNLSTVDLLGGAPVKVCAAGQGRGGTWTRDGMILFAPALTTGIYEVAASGGTPRPITTLAAGETSHRWPRVLPDGKHFIYLAINHDPTLSAADALYWASLDGKENRKLMRSDSDAVFGDGYLLFDRGSQLLAQAFNPATGTLSSEPQPLARGVVYDPATWKMAVSVAPDGLLVFGQGGAGVVEPELAWLDRTGKTTGTLPLNLTGLLSFSLSPHGRRAAVVLDAGIADIWVIDLGRGTRTRLTAGPIGNTFPAWSPDGQWIAYTSLRDGHNNIYRRRADGSGSEELLLADGNTNIPSSWSPDGKTLLYTRAGDGPRSQIWQLPLDGDRRPTPLLPGHVWTRVPRFSPDGRWIAFTGGESGQLEVYVIPFPARPGQWQVSVNGGAFNGGADARWDRSGKSIVVIDSSGNLYSVPVTLAQATPQFGPPQRLFAIDYDPLSQRLDLAPDGRFLGTVSQAGETSLTLMHPWTAALKK